MKPEEVINNIDIVEHFSEGFMLINSEGKIVLWNKALEEISGLKREDVLGRDHYQVMFGLVLPEKRTPETLQYLKASLEEAVKGNHPLIDNAFEGKIMTRQGEIKTVLQTAFLLKTESGINLGAGLRDISERTRQEEELRQKENRYRLLFEYLRPAHSMTS